MSKKEIKNPLAKIICRESGNEKCIIKDMRSIINGKYIEAECTDEFGTKRDYKYLLDSNDKPIFWTSEERYKKSE